MIHLYLSVVINFNFCPFQSYQLLIEPVFVEELALNAVSKVNSAVQVHFAEATKTNEARVLCNIGRFPVEKFLEWTVFSNAIAETKIEDVISVQVGSVSKSVKLTIFKSFPVPVHQEIVTKVIYRVLQASFAVTTDAEKDPRLSGFFYTLFLAEQSSKALFYESQFLQDVFNSARRDATATSGLTTPCIFEGNTFFSL